MSLWNTETNHKFISRWLVRCPLTQVPHVSTKSWRPPTWNIRIESAVASATWKTRRIQASARMSLQGPSNWAASPPCLLRSSGTNSWTSQQSLCLSLSLSISHSQSSPAGDGQWWAEAAEEHSDPGGHQGASDGQDWRHHHWPAAVQQVQEEELHLQPGKEPETLTLVRFHVWSFVNSWSGHFVCLYIKVTPKNCIFFFLFCVANWK